MRFKLLVILTILTFSVSSVTYSHDKEKYIALFDPECHSTSQDDFHCHVHNSASDPFPTYTEQKPGLLGENGDYILIGAAFTISIVGLWLALRKIRNNRWMFGTSDTPDAAYRYLNQLPTQIPVNTSLTPRFDFTRQEHIGWEFRTSFTFRF